MGEEMLTIHLIAGFIVGGLFVLLCALYLKFRKLNDKITQHFNIFRNNDNDLRELLDQIDYITESEDKSTAIKIVKETACDIFEKNAWSVRYLSELNKKDVKFYRPGMTDEEWA